MLLLAAAGTHALDMRRAYARVGGAGITFQSRYGAIVASESGDQEDANRKGNLLRLIYSRDVTYWPMSRFFRRQFMGVLGASRDVVAGLTPGRRSIIERMIEYMNPASLRSAGVRMDNEPALPGERIAEITAPTLIVHARDDLLQLYHNAAFAAATIPGARLLSFDSGGHVVLAVERAAIQRAVRQHILVHAADVGGQRGVEGGR